jgi:hypothetical protein
MSKGNISTLPIILLTLLICVLGGRQTAMALGADHPKGKVSAMSGWPKGMAELVNSDARIHGFLVNAVDIFFFQGGQDRFEQFLGEYAKIDGLASRTIVVHSGIGRAKSPWQKDEGVPCDWKIYGCPASEKGRDPAAKGYILEVHVWEEGVIKLDGLKLPEGVTIKKSKDAESEK